MPNNSKIQLTPDKAKVFKTMDIRPTSDNINEYNEIFDEMYAVALAAASPSYNFAILENSMEVLETYDCKYVLYAIFTLGSEISKRIKSYFDAGDYIEGMMLDHIADNLVGQVDDALKQRILVALKERKQGSTKRLTPGEQIDIKNQIQIVRNVGSGAGVRLTESYMLNPVKSGSFILGVDESLPIVEISHDCSSCKNFSCKWRTSPYQLVK